MRSIGSTSARPAPTLLSAIPPISGNNQNPDLFPLLKYALPSASISEILSIGASLIDQRDQNPDTSWIEFDAGGTQKAFGVDRTPSSEIGAPVAAESTIDLERRDHKLRRTSECG